MTSQTSHLMPKAFKKLKRRVTSSARVPGRSWQVQSAKAKFSEVFRLARTEGPQHITRQGKEGVVMISDEQYDQLIIRSRQPKSIVQFFRESPLVGVDLDLTRDKDAGHDIEL
jgi:antitoxin Phd